MNKHFSKIAALSVGLAMAVGVGVAVNSKSKNALPVFAGSETATLTFTGACGGTGIDDMNNSWTITSDADESNYDATKGIHYGTGKLTVEYIQLVSDAFDGKTITQVDVNASGASGVTGSVSVTVGGNAFGTVQSFNATASDKTFTSSASAGQIVVRIYKDVAAVKAIYCKSVAVTYEVEGGDTYSVTYDKNDSTSRAASGMPANVSGLEDDEVVSLTGSPTRWGYTFLGWGATPNATSYLTSLTIDGADKTVYAIWGEDHTVPGAWSDSPYTVAQARAAIDANENLKDVYVAGIISQVDSYNSTYKSIQYWISDDGTTTNQFEVYSGKGINGADFSSVNDVKVGAQVVVNGDIKLYSSTYEFDKSSKQISYIPPSTGDIEVTFDPSAFLGVNDKGTFTASTEAKNPTYTFSSSDSSVLTVASNGAFEAKAAGTVTVRVDVTSVDGNGYQEASIAVVEVKTVSEAYDIASELATGATTSYSIKVTGALSNFDADGKSRAVNITDGDKVMMIFFGGTTEEYTTVTSTGFVGSKVTVYARVQNYSGTYELKDITLEGVAQGDADSYGAGAYKFLDGSCETGPEAVTNTQWTDVSDGFDALDAADQAEFRKAVVSGNVEKWVGRYTRIVSNTSLNDFISLGISSSRIQPFAAAEDSNLMLIVVITTIASVSAIAILLVIKRRKSSRK